MSHLLRAPLSPSPETSPLRVNQARRGPLLLLRPLVPLHPLAVSLQGHKQAIRDALPPSVPTHSGVPAPPVAPSCRPLLSPPPVAPSGRPLLLPPSLALLDLPLSQALPPNAAELFLCRGATLSTSRPRRFIPIETRRLSFFSCPQRACPSLDRLCPLPLPGSGAVENARDGVGGDKHRGGMKLLETLSPLQRCDG